MTVGKIILTGIKVHSSPLELPLQLVSIFAGANSSGKSTVIQALLLIRQSFDPFMDRAGLKVQGSILDLGEPANILSRGLATSECSIDLTFSDDDYSSHFRFTAALNESTKHLDLVGLDFDEQSFRAVDGEPRSPRLVSTDGTRAVRLNGLFVAEELHRTLGAFPDELKSTFSERFRSNCANVLSRLLDQVPKRTELERVAAENGRKAIEAQDWRGLNPYLEELLSQGGQDKSDAAPEVRKLVGRLRSLNAISADLLDALVCAAEYSELEVDVFELLQEMVRQSDDISIDEFMPSDHGIARRFNGCLSAFVASMRYVGPVRQGPQSIYPHSGITQANDVSADGTGLVPLLAQSWHSDSTLKSPDGAAGTVGQVISAWYRYLGVAHDLSVEELPDIGFRLKVSVTPGHWDMVRNVGVGVTQILPIVGQLALMRRGETLLIEQPELHLHPSVAVRLGELAAAAGRDGLQVLVETHSEHFVNGVRLGVANDVLAASDAFVGFFDRLPGRSTIVNVRRIAVDADGFMSEWPQGFFDQSEEVSIKLMQMKSRSGS